MKRRTVGRAVLEQQIRDAKTRLIELERLAAGEDEGSYKRQELLNEMIDTRRIRDIVASKLDDVDVPDTLSPERAEMFRLLVAERRESTLAFIEKLEREGDFHQARIWRLSLLDIPGQVAREI